MFDRSKLSTIPSQLWSVFLPQLDQLGATSLDVAFGVAALIKTDTCKGWYWSAAVEEDCLITAMRIESLQPQPLQEHPSCDYSVLSSMTSYDAELMSDIWSNQGKAEAGYSLNASAVPIIGQQVAAFSVHAGSYRFDLSQGSVHGGTNICFLPSFLERRARTYPECAVVMQTLFDDVTPLDGALELKAALRTVTPLQAAHISARSYYRAKVEEALSLAVMHVADREGHYFGRGRTDDLTHNPEGSISDHVTSLLANSLDAPPSLDEIAAWLYMSKTALCKTFREETGMSIGACIADLRIARAKQLLKQTDCPLAQIARQIGYRHQSSFDAAFKRAAGMTPSQWRQQRDLASELHGPSR